MRRELRLDPGEARGRVAAARVLRDLPATAAALGAGEITAGHVRVLAAAAKRVGGDVLADAEPTLLTLAKSAPPQQLRVAVDRLATAVDADDDRDARALARHEGRYVRLTEGYDGGYDLAGALDEAGGRILQALLTAHGGRHRLPDGTPDPRSRGSGTPTPSSTPPP